MKVICKSVCHQQIMISNDLAEELYQKYQNVYEDIVKGLNDQLLSKAADRSSKASALLLSEL